jgi:hypothetical protein
MARKRYTAEEIIQSAALGLDLSAVFCRSFLGMFDL